MKTHTHMCARTRTHTHIHGGGQTEGQRTQQAESIRSYARVVSGITGWRVTMCTLLSPASFYFNRRGQEGVVCSPGYRTSKGTTGKQHGQRESLLGFKVTSSAV